MRSEELQAKTEILTDGFGRRHDYLRISLTERCNLRCFYCMPEEGIPLRDRAEFMRVEEVVELAQIFVSLGVRKIRLTGGEPLVRKGAHDIITQLGDLPVELAISTNGILVNQFIDTFRLAGIKAVNVSLDSLDAGRQARITRRDYFHRIFQNIEALVDGGFDTKINTVVMRGVNDHEIIDFVELTGNWPVEVRFIEFMPFQGNSWSRDKCVSMAEIESVLGGHYGESLLPLNGDEHDTARRFTIAGYRGDFGVIASVSQPFCGGCNRMRLTADGKMKNCLFSPVEADLLTALRQGHDVKPLIRQNIGMKKAVRAGLTTAEALGKTTAHNHNRSMVRIGG